MILIKSRQPSMRQKQRAALTHGHFESLNCPIDQLQPHQCASEIEMRHRQMMLQPDCENRGTGGLVIPPLPEKRAGEILPRDSVVRVDFERAFECPLCVSVTE